MCRAHFKRYCYFLCSASSANFILVYMCRSQVLLLSIKCTLFRSNWRHKGWPYFTFVILFCIVFVVWAQSLPGPSLPLISGTGILGAGADQKGRSLWQRNWCGPLSTTAAVIFSKTPETLSGPKNYFVCAMFLNKISIVNPFLNLQCGKLTRLGWFAP